MAKQSETAQKLTKLINTVDKTLIDLRKAMGKIKESLKELEEHGQNQGKE